MSARLPGSPRRTVDARFKVRRKSDADWERAVRRWEWLAFLVGDATL